MSAVVNLQKALDIFEAVDCHCSVSTWDDHRRRCYANRIKTLLEFLGYIVIVDVPINDD